MKKVLSTIKQIMLTQLLSIIFAVIAEMQQRILISNDKLFSNGLLLSIGLILLIIVYVIFINLFLEGRWINIVLISVPYIIYWFLIFFISCEMFPTNNDPNDYGIGITIIILIIYQWSSVLIASILGTYLKIKRCKLAVKY